MTSMDLCFVPEYKMDFQALTDVYNFEIRYEYLRLDINLRRGSYAPMMGRARQQQEAIGFTEFYFREMNNIVDKILCRPRLAAMLRTWAPVADVKGAKVIQKFLKERVVGHWFWSERNVVDVVAIMLFRRLGVSQQLVSRLIICEKWMSGEFRKGDDAETRLKKYCSVDKILPGLIGPDVRVAYQIQDNEEYSRIACQILRSLPLIQFRADAWDEGSLTLERLACFLNEDEDDVRPVAEYIGLVLV